MKHKTFFWFILPTLTAMTLFIALPIVSVFIQSLHIQHEQVLITVENCGPFGCTEETVIDQEATRALRDAQPLGQFNGLGTYTNRAHLAFGEIGEAWATTESWGAFFDRVLGLPFYRALAFTLTYTFVVTPFVLLIGLAVAGGGQQPAEDVQGADDLLLAAADDDHAAGGLSDPSLDGGCRRHHRGRRCRTS